MKFEIQIFGMIMLRAKLKISFWKIESLNHKPVQENQWIKIYFYSHSRQPEFVITTSKHLEIKLQFNN